MTIQLKIFTDERTGQDIYINPVMVESVIGIGGTQIRMQSGFVLNVRERLSFVTKSILGEYPLQSEAFNPKPAPVEKILKICMSNGSETTVTKRGSSCTGKMKK